eukprot:10912779-Karenia_brevis.AAC.1
MATGPSNHRTTPPRSNDTNTTHPTYTMSMNGIIEIPGLSMYQATRTHDEQAHSPQGLGGMP